MSKVYSSHILDSAIGYFGECPRAISIIRIFIINIIKNKSVTCLAATTTTATHHQNTILARTHAFRDTQKTTPKGWRRRRPVGDFAQPTHTMAAERHRSDLCTKAPRTNQRTSETSQRQRATGATLATSIPAVVAPTRQSRPLRPCVSLCCVRVRVCLSVHPPPPTQHTVTVLHNSVGWGPVPKSAATHTNTHADWRTHGIIISARVHVPE